MTTAQTPGHVATSTTAPEPEPVTASATDDPVMRALRLGWYLAEFRGRSRPDAPPGSHTAMHDRAHHALPLRVERTPTELRIQALAVVQGLAADALVDCGRDGSSYSEQIDTAANVVAYERAEEVLTALHEAITVLQPAGRGCEHDAPDAGGVLDRSLEVLAKARAEQRRVVDTLPAERARRARDHAERVLAVIEHVAEMLRHARTDDPVTVGDAAARELRDQFAGFGRIAQRAWEDLAELLYHFDAHIQDRLAAISETQACAYQLGRGLAETYWALDPTAADGSSMGWTFLLGEERCGELSRLVGRLGARLHPYTASAIAGSLEIWHDVVTTDDWRGDPTRDQQALYRQIRRWYELLVLSQDPTTLIAPDAMIRNWRTLAHAIRMFWPQLAASVVGLAGVGALLAFLTFDSGSGAAKTLSAVLAAVGLSVAGLTGALKNSAQAISQRLRQDGYTDLVAIAVQSAPPPPSRRELRRAISRRHITPATPN
jgi:hypothetical protein